MNLVKWNLPKPVDSVERMNRLETSMPYKRRGATVYSKGKNTIPAASAVSANGQISSSGITAAGSTTSFVVSGQLGFVATANGMTIYWDGTNNSTILTIQRSDGTATTVPSGSQTITGLAKSTSYGFACYWNISQGTSGSLAFGSGPAGTPGIAVPSTANISATATALAQLQASSAEAIYSGLVYFSTPGSGTSSGNGKSASGAAYTSVRVRGFSQ